MRKLDKKFIRSHAHQEIIITGSALFKTLELIGIWLHIIAFVVGFISVVGVLSGSILGHGNEELEHIKTGFEITTLVVIALILLQFAVTPILEKIVLKNILKDFWGTNEIATSMKYPTDIDPITNFGTILSEVDSVQLEETRISWTVSRYIPFKQVLTIQQCTPITTKRWSKYASTDGTFNTVVVPLYIIIDLKQKSVKLQGRSNVLFTRQKEIPEKRIMFTFHYKERVAEWSGLFPDHPLYGEWIWDSEVTKEIKLNTAGEKNQAIKNNQAVAEAFKRKRGNSARRDVEVKTSRI